MLSILIPVYNYNALPLTLEVHKQCETCNINFEILLIDDASDHVQTNFEEINNLSNTELKLLNSNIGRSAIRNLLAKKSKYDTLLFIDAGTYPKNSTFISNYLQHIESPIVVGGMIADEIKPKSPYTLRWLYTKEREENSLCSSNFMIKKSIFNNNTFDESLKQYGYEDVLFFKELKEKDFKIDKIDNPVIHDAMDTSSNFIFKSELGLKNLHHLISLEKLNHSASKISLVYKTLKKYKISNLIGFLLNHFKKTIQKNLNSSNPSLMLFDLYRLGYYIKINKNK